MGNRLLHQSHAARRSSAVPARSESHNALALQLLEHPHRVRQLRLRLRNAPAYFRVRERSYRFATEQIQTSQKLRTPPASRKERFRVRSTAHPTSVAETIAPITRANTTARSQLRFSRSPSATTAPSKSP